MKALSELLVACLDSSGAAVRPTEEQVILARKDFARMELLIRELAVECPSGLNCTMKRLIHTANEIVNGKRGTRQ